MQKARIIWFEIRNPDRHSPPPLALILSPVWKHPGAGGTASRPGPFKACAGAQERDLTDIRRRREPRFERGAVPELLYMKKLFNYLTAMGLASCCGLAHAESPLLRSIDIQSRAAVNTQDVYQRLSPYLNKEVNHELLQNVLDEITKYYKEQGYPTSKAYLPVQTSDDGVLRVEVLTTNIREVKIKDSDMLTSGARERLFARVREMKGDAINVKQLENSLLRLTDLGSFDINGQFDMTGTEDEVDFKVFADPRQKFDFAVFADNHGTEAAGEYRLGLYGAVKNLTHNADNLSLFAARSDEDQTDFNISYDIPLNSYPTVVGGSICYNMYDLAKEYELLGAEGTALSFDLYLKHTILRSRQDRLVYSLGGYYKKLEDSFDVFGIDFEKHETALYTGLSYSYDDQKYYFTGMGKGTFGKLSNDDDYDIFDDGNYLIYNQDLTAGYYFTPGWMALATLNVQASNTNLNGSEQFNVSGAEAIAAYDHSILSTDSGAIAQLGVQYQYKGEANFRIRPHFDYGYGKSHGYDSENLAGVGVDSLVQYKGMFARLQLNHALKDVDYVDNDDFKVFLSVGYQNV